MAHRLILPLPKDNGTILSSFGKMPKDNGETLSSFGKIPKDNGETSKRTI